MKVDLITLGTPGVQDIALPFQPTWMEFHVGARYNNPSSCVHLSDGYTDGTNQTCRSTYGDTTGAKTINVNNKVVSQYQRTAGVITESLAASFVEFNTTGVRLNVTIPSSSYQVTIVYGT